MNQLLSKITKYDLAFIGIRLLTIYLMIVAISAFPKWLLEIARAMAVGVPFIVIFWVFILPVVAILIPILLWVYARKLSRFVVGSNDLRSDDGVATGNTDLLSILLSVVGCFVLVITLPDVIQWIYSCIHVYYKYHGKIDEPPYPLVLALIPPLVKIIFSLMLIFGSKGISRLVAKVKS